MRISSGPWFGRERCCYFLLRMFLWYRASESCSCLFSGFPNAPVLGKSVTRRLECLRFAEACSVDMCLFAPVVLCNRNLMMRNPKPLYSFRDTASMRFVAGNLALRGVEAPPAIKRTPPPRVCIGPCVMQMAKRDRQRQGGHGFLANQPPCKGI